MRLPCRWHSAGGLKVNPVTRNRRSRWDRSCAAERQAAARAGRRVCPGPVSTLRFRETAVHQACGCSQGSSLSCSLAAGACSIRRAESAR
ncbi:Hypothetical protein EPM1_2310 [Stenotrophomonas maltophilia EPM1]|nr:Hypothetical protein EPM1_2310 [Stenotrophomonas maltophilia EPM1]